MYIRYNPNPLNLNTGDCVVRAICAATGQTWDAVYRGIVLTGAELCKMPTTNEVWEKYLVSLGYVRHDLPDRCPDCYTVADFAADHPRGVYILGTGDHAVTVIDGTYFDNWDSGKRVPLYYFTKQTEDKNNGILSHRIPHGV